MERILKITDSNLVDKMDKLNSLCHCHNVIQYRGGGSGLLARAFIGDLKPLFLLYLREENKWPAEIISPVKNC